MLNQSRRGDAGEGMATVLAFLAVVTILIMLMAIGYDAGERAKESEAVKAGVGEYYAPDPTKKELKFRFKAPTSVEH